MEERQELLEAKRTYPDKYTEEEIVEAFETGAAGVLDNLVEEGLLKEKHVDQFVDGHPAQAAEKAQKRAPGLLLDVTYSRVEDRPVTTLWARTVRKGNEIIVTVRPETDWASAIVRRKGDHEKLVLEDQVVDNSGVGVDHPAAVNVAGTLGSVQSSDCSVCRKDCGPYYATYLSTGSSSCDCGSRQPTCDECPDLSKCDDSGW